MKRSRRLRRRPAGSASASESLSAFENAVFDSDSDPEVCLDAVLFSEQEPCDGWRERPVDADSGAWDFSGQGADSRISKDIKGGGDGIIGGGIRYGQAQRE